MTVGIDRIEQDTRAAILHTPLAMDTLGLIDFTGHESVNELYEFTVRAFAPDPSAVQVNALIGKPFQIELRTPSGGTRWINGLAVSVTPLGEEMSGGATYEIELRPWLWLAGLRRRSRIFDCGNLSELIAAVLSDYLPLAQSANSVMLQGGATLDRRYTVQYRETDLDFLRRMLERYGANFHFEMRDGVAELVISDDNSAFAPLQGSTRPLHPVGTHRHDSGERFVTWIDRNSLTMEAVRLTDYDPLSPNQNLTVTATDPTGRVSTKTEEYDHPSGYLVEGAGNAMARRRLMAHRSQALRVAASGDVMSLSAGKTVTLTNHPDSSQNRAYIALQCRHHYRAESYLSGPGGGGASYSGHYELLPHDVPVAPMLRTPVARVYGPVLGVVVKGPEEQPDELGWISVRFHWESEGKDSMPCRVAQSWAGNGWGAQFIPRVGMEVVVEFLDGDPDMPLVTGCVYNGENRPAFDPKHDSLHSGWRTHSDEGFNQISMDDTASKERVVVHAQRDMEVTILNDLTEKVEGSVRQDVTGSETVKVKGNVLIKSESKIRLEVGTSSIEITEGAIKIKAMEVVVEATANLTTKAGMEAQHRAGALMTIMAGLVKIN